MRSERRPMLVSPTPALVQPGRAFSYLLSGLTVSSELILPSAFQSTSPAQPAQVTIREGDVPAVLAGAHAGGGRLATHPKAVSTEHSFRRQISGVGW